MEDLGPMKHSSSSEFSMKKWKFYIEESQESSYNGYALAQWLDGLKL